MDKVEFLVIFPTYSNLEVVKQTLPIIIEETNRFGNARLIVHDSTEMQHGQEEKWAYLKELEEEHKFFLLLSTNLSMAHARNMCLSLAQEMYAPDYICMIEDDHGFNPGVIEALVTAMKEYYGKVSPNGLRFGMFSPCILHTDAKLVRLTEQYSYPSSESAPFSIGGYNSCFRCAPANHWYSVLKGYDTDEYLISNYQTANLRWRNYNKGFTVLFIDHDEKVFSIDAEGRGETSDADVKLWDRKYTASDKRSKYIGKDQTSEEARLRENHKFMESCGFLKYSIKSLIISSSRWIKYMVLSKICLKKKK